MNRASISGMEITDAQKEREAINALRDAESRVNHSVRAIALRRGSIIELSTVGVDHRPTRSSHHAFQQAFSQSNETLS